MKRNQNALVSALHSQPACHWARFKELTEEMLLIVMGWGRRDFKEMQKYSRVIKYPLFSVKVNVPGLR